MFAYLGFIVGCQARGGGAGSDATAAMMAPANEGATLPTEPPASAQDGRKVRTGNEAWGSADDGGNSCGAYPSTRADGCDLTWGESVRFGPGNADFADSQAQLRCGEEAEACGERYRCECQTCAALPDYATRMQRGRHLDVSGEGRFLRVTVEYEGGTCEAGGDADWGATGLCAVYASDRSNLGGCRRRTMEGAKLKSRRTCATACLCDASALTPANGS